MHFSFLKSVILKHLSQKPLKSAKKRDFWALGARNTDFWVVVKTANIVHGQLGRLLTLFSVYSLFSKIGDFSVFWRHFRLSQNRGISGISKPSQYFDSHSQRKNDSTFVEVSIESSDFRAFDRALNEGATYFSFQVMPILVSRKCYFLRSKIFKMSQLVAFRRRLLKIKRVCPPPKKKSRFKNSRTRRFRSNNSNFPAL